MLSHIIKQNFLDIPQNSDGNARSNHTDFAITFVVERNRAPIFFLEIKPPEFFNSLSARADADNQMRRRLCQLYEASPSELHGFSVFGMRCCRYSLYKIDGSIEPKSIPSRPQYITDTAPKKWWNLDILDRDGYEEFSGVVQHVKSLG